jgi:hypothetical protein
MEIDRNRRPELRWKMNVDKCYSDILHIGLKPF